MNTLLASWVLLAEQAPGGGNTGGGNPFGFMLPIAVILMLGYFMLVRPEKRKQAMHREMLLNLQKNDRVITVGGIKGIVANVHREANEVTVNVDESTGTKIKVTLDSIARVEGGKSEKAEDEKK